MEKCNWCDKKISTVDKEKHEEYCTEYIKTKCPNCNMEMRTERWIVEKDDFYCSEECCYNAETGHPGEEY